MNESEQITELNRLPRNTHIYINTKDGRKFSLYKNNNMQWKQIYMCTFTTEEIVAVAKSWEVTLRGK